MPTLLDARAPRREPTPGFRGTLRAPQAALFAEFCVREAALAVEAAPRVPVARPRGAGFGAGFGRCQFPFIGIQAPPSFGKTVLAAAILCLPPPPPRRLPLFAPTETVVAVAAEPWRRLRGLSVIVATLSVLSQWAALLREFAPDIRVFVVDNYASLLVFRRMVATGLVRHYDAVLVKIGTVSGRALGYAGTESADIVAAFARELDGHQVGRVFYDDLDTANASSQLPLVPADTIVVLSATFRAGLRHPYPLTPDNASGFDGPPADFIAGARLRMPALLFVNSLRDFGGENGAAVLACADDFLAAHYQTPAFRQRRLVVAGGGLARLAADLGADAETLEMLNANATRSAAHAMGFVCTTAPQFLRCLLHKRLEELAVSRAQLAALRAVFGPGFGAGAGGETGVPAPRGAREAWASGGAAALAGLAGEARARAMAGLGDSGFAAWAGALVALQDRAARALERLRENLRENGCQVCCAPREELRGGLYITNCCQTVICSDCIEAGIAGKNCPTCSVLLSRVGVLCVPATDFFAAHDLETALETVLEASAGAGADAAASSAAASSAAGDAGNDTDEIVRGLLEAADAADNADQRKIAAFVAAFSGRPPPALRDVEIPAGRQVSGVLGGGPAVARPAGAPRRALVFAKHTETTVAIRAALRRVGIDAELLHGSRATKDQLVAWFKAPLPAGASRVLVVTASRQSAGLHLPETTDVVFFHRFGDAALVRQAVGRAQRLGRTASLEVLELFNEFEDRFENRGENPGENET